MTNDDHDDQGDHYKRGMVLYEHKRWDMAEKEFRTAVAQQPEHAGSRAMLSLCLRQLGRYQPAMQEAGEAIRLNPEGAHNHYVLFLALTDLKNFAAAQDAIDRAKQLLPQCALYHAEDARLALVQGKNRTALEKSMLALSLNPEDDHSRWIHAMSLYRLGEREEAIAAAGGTLQLTPEGADAHALMGWVFFSRWSDTSWELIPNVQSKPSWADDTIKSDQYKRAGDQLSSAIEHFLCALRIEPVMKWASEGLRQALNDELKAAHQTMKASKLKLCEKQQDERILTLCHDQLNEGVLRAWALTELGKLEEADMVAQEALRGEADTAYIHAFQGWISLKQKKASLSMRHFREALQLQPDLACARIGLVQALIPDHGLFKIFLPIVCLFAPVIPASQILNIAKDQ